MCLCCIFLVACNNSSSPSFAHSSKDHAAPQAPATSSNKTDGSTDNQSTPSEKDERSVYLNYYSPLLKSLSDEMGTLSDLLKNPNVGDQTWNENIAMVLVLMKKTLSDMKSYDGVVPDSLKESHQHLMTAVDDYMHTPEDLPAAIDNQDTQAIQEINNYTNDGNKELNLSTQALEKVK